MVVYVVYDPETPEAAEVWYGDLHPGYVIELLKAASTAMAQKYRGTYHVRRTSFLKRMFRRSRTTLLPGSEKQA